MAAIRALCILIVLIAFFLIGTPLQWLVSRYAPTAADRIPTFFCRSLLWLLKIEVDVKGTIANSKPTLAVANHVSWIDVLVLGHIEPFCFLAKSEVSGWPILSAFAAVQGTIFIDRKRRRTIPTANRVMATRMREKRAVLLFPEGTTVAAAEPAAFQSSHFAAARDLLRADPEQSSVNIQPIAIAYSAGRAAWVGDDGLVSHLWRTLRAPPLRCAICFGPPIDYFVDSDRKFVAKTARASIVDMMNRLWVGPDEAYATIGLGRASATSVP